MMIDNYLIHEVCCSVSPLASFLELTRMVLVQVGLALNNFHSNCILNENIILFESVRHLGMKC